MKPIYYIALAITLMGCSLDERPLDQIPEEAGYKDMQSLYQNAVATLYNYIGGNKDGEGLQGTCRGVYDLQTFGSDEAILPTRGIDWYDSGLWQQMYKHSWTPGHELLGNSWNYLYKVIALCNNSLEKLDEHKDVAGIFLDPWKAEVRALRAIYYWYLIDLFGDVPLILSTTVSKNDVAQTPRAEVFKFIVAELEETLPDVPSANSVKKDLNYGHVTNAVSMFVLAKLMLNAPVYTGTVSDTCYQRCIYYCNLISDEGYKLEEDYAQNFIVGNEQSCENIFVIPMDKDIYTNEQQNILRSIHYRHAQSLGFTGENGSCATLHTLQVYGYQGEDMLDSVDPRFADNFYFGPIATVNDRTGAIFTYVPEAVELDLSHSPYLETAGARMRKYELEAFTHYSGRLMDNDIVLFRFADVLLMRAEAKLRLGLDGHDDYDRVRRRAGAEPRPYTLDNLYDERLLELCWEGWRRQDMIRFGKYRSLYTGPDAVDESDGHTTIFPIPGGVINNNRKIKQNPGY